MSLRRNNSFMLRVKQSQEEAVANIFEQSFAQEDGWRFSFL
jgi:hypothetical protein